MTAIETVFQFEKMHLIEVLDANGRSEFFTGWNDLNELTGPEFSSDREYATKYDLTFHRDEVLADYEALRELGFDASIETISFFAPDWRPSKSARLEAHFSIAAE